MDNYSFPYWTKVLLKMNDNDLMEVIENYPCKFSIGSKEDHKQLQDRVKAIRQKT